MANGINKTTRDELINTLRKRYQEVSKREKTRILNEFVAVSGYHRKHASRLLGGMSKEKGVKNQLPVNSYTTRQLKKHLLLSGKPQTGFAAKDSKQLYPIS